MNRKEKEPQNRDRDNIDMDPSIDDPSIRKDVLMPLSKLISSGFSSEENSHVHFQQTENRKLFRKCRVAGLYFHDAEDLIEDLSKGDRLFLIREPDNEHDSNAVAVAFADEYEYDDDTVTPDEFSVLGYVPRDQNADIAAMLDMGWAGILECEVFKTKMHGNPEERLEIAIYIKSNATVITPDHRLWAMVISDREHADIMKFIQEKGYVYFRWVSTPLYSHDLPKEREDIVSYNHSTNEAILLKVIAIGSNATPFFVSTDDIEMTDDSCPFIATLIAGPITLKGEDAGIFENAHDLQSQPEVRLSECDSDKILSLFRNRSSR